MAVPRDDNAGRALIRIQLAPARAARPMPHNRCR
jgi:hypothetical protein